MKLRRTAKYWRSRAEESRTIADLMRNPETKQMILEVAESYDRLAEHAEEASQAEGSQISDLAGRLRKRRISSPKSSRHSVN
jgi:predicted S18 family serine protease